MRFLWLIIIGLIFTYLTKFYEWDHVKVEDIKVWDAKDHVFKNKCEL